ncbi:MAG: AEC family transporter [Kiritimatiellae bacterium]|nr:AEC family transporter [Kiritimatiellia bacterium]
MHVISALAPVFMLVAVGYLLLRWKFADDAFFHVAAKFAYWIGLPSLLFKNIAEASLSLSDAGRVFAVMAAASILTALVSAPVARALGLSATRGRTFIHTSFHCNTAFVGLPVMLYSLTAYPDSDKLIEMASMALAPMIPVFNIMSVIVMRGAVDTAKKGLLVIILKKVVTNPQVLSCLAGLAVAFCGFRLPLALSRSVGSLGSMALPLALMSIGAGLNLRNVRDGLGAACLAAFFNVVMLPLIGFGLCRFGGLTSGETLVSLIFLTCPTASSAYIYARQMKGDPSFAGNVILISTLMSAPALWAVLYFGL